jgi:hypothetical protein
LIAPLFFTMKEKQPEKRKQNRTPQGKRKDQTGFTITLSWKGRGRSRGCPRRAVLTCLVYKTMLCSTYSLVCCLSKKVVKSQFGKRVENGAGQRGLWLTLSCWHTRLGSWQVEVAVVMISAKSTNFTLFSSQHNIKGD